MPIRGSPICRGRGYPRFWTRVYKLQLHVHPSMWPNLVEFRSASSEIRRRKKNKERRWRIPVKRKSADRYVGRPNNWSLSIMPLFTQKKKQKSESVALRDARVMLLFRASWSIVPIVIVFGVVFVELYMTLWPWPLTPVLTLSTAARRQCDQWRHQAP